MLVDIYFMNGEDVPVKGIHAIIVPKGIDPKTIAKYSGKKITYKFKDSEDLKASDKRTALDSKKAIEDITQNGFHIMAAEIKVTEE